MANEYAGMIVIAILVIAVIIAVLVGIFKQDDYDITVLPTNMSCPAIPNCTPTLICNYSIPACPDCLTSCNCPKSTYYVYSNGTDFPSNVTFIYQVNGTTLINKSTFYSGLADYRFMYSENNTNYTYICEVS